MKICVDNLTFDFPPEWSASKYDDWAFYRCQFSKMRNEIKAVDLIAIDPARTVWFVEVKDYRGDRQRTRTTDLPLEVAKKVFDTLAALLPAKTNANVAIEKDIAKKAVCAKKIRVVLHLEQPAKNSKLFRNPIDPANVYQELRRILKPIDAHPFVAQKTAMGSLPWSVT